MSDEQPFVFQGVRSYLRAAAEGYPDLRPGDLGRADRVDAIARANDALTQACHVAPGDRHAVAVEAERQRDVLALALEGMEAAILDVYAQLELPSPAFAGGSVEERPAGAGAAEPGQAAPPRQVPEWRPQTANPKRPHDTSTLAPHAAPAPTPAPQEEAPPPKEELPAEKPAQAPEPARAPAAAPKAAPGAGPKPDEEPKLGRNKR